MIYEFELTTPAEDPFISLDDAKMHAHIDASIEVEDALTAAYVQAATSVVEQATGIQCRAETWTLRLPGFPCGKQPLRIPKGVIDEVVSVSYLDSSGESHTLDGASLVRPWGGWAYLMPAYGESWPYARPYPGSVQVVFTTALQTDERAAQAVRLLAAHWMNVRESSSALTYEQVPDGLRFLIGQLCIAEVVG